MAAYLSALSIAVEQELQCIPFTVTCRLTRACWVQTRQEVIISDQEMYGKEQLLCQYFKREMSRQHYLAREKVLNLKSNRIQESVIDAQRIFNYHKLALLDHLLGTRGAKHQSLELLYISSALSGWRICLLQRPPPHSESIAPSLGET